jgi:diguanylate cyclase
MVHALRVAVACVRRRPELAVALGATVYAACALTGWAGGTAALVVGNATMILLPVVGALLAVRAGARLRGRARLAWVLCGLSGALWACGQATWALYDFVLHAAPPLPGPPDLFYAPALPLLALGVLALPAAPRARLSRLWLLLDAVLVTGALVTVSWVLVMRPLWHADAAALSQAFALYYPLGDVVVGALAVLTMLRAREGGSRAQWLLLGAVGALLVSDLAFGVMSLDGSYATGALVDVGWWGAYLLVGLAARAYRPGVVPPADRPASRLVLVLPNLLVLPMLVALWWGFAVGRLDRVVLTVAVSAVCALVVRQWLVNWEHARLAAEVTRRETHYRHLAHHDDLTGLANRARLRAALEDALASGVPPALVVLDLDGFKNVNDSLGHQAGDAVLVAVSRRLERVVRGDDTVARLGGDEFAVLPGSGADAEVLAERLREAASGTYLVQGTEVTLGASAGVAAGGSAAGPDEILRNADLALYRAKRAGRGRVARYEPRLHAEAVARVRVEAALRRSLDDGGFRLHYQPVLDLATHRPVGAEALLRWDRPGHGLVGPRDFLRVAEESGLVLPLGEWVVREGCRYAAAWHAQGLSLTTGVNLSARQIHESDLVATVARALADTGAPPDRFVLEVTENVLLDDLDHAVGVLRGLRDLGVHVALDDFGTGYSSLSYLSRLPVDILKIDRSFVADVLRSDHHRVLVDTVVTLGHKLGLDVVAEGVESARQADVLRATGVAYAQGYHFSPPVPADRLPEVVHALAAPLPHPETAVSPS